LIITFLPLGDALPVAGQRMIAILVFAIIVWISEAMDYTASAIVISVLIIFMVGFAPDIHHPESDFRHLESAEAGVIRVF
jgi:di/tricarboxylate transporter